MSRIPQPSRGAPPKSGGTPRPPQTFRPTASSTIREPDTSRTPYSVAGTGKQAAKSEPRKSCLGPKTKKRTESDYELPAISTLKRIDKDAVAESELEKLKRKTARRNAPEGEDLPRIKELMKSIKEQDVSVHEFVGLVAAYTADNGTILRTVLATELSHFRNLARKVYDTMTQDVGDVLTNEHIQLTESSKEKHAIYGDKMMRAIDEIYELFPNFNFEKYYTDPEYVQMICPTCSPEMADELEEQNIGRQEAYHRMMWLRSEGERLQAENKKLHERLYELKLRQKDELTKASQIDNDKERKRIQLETQQNQLQDKLDDLNASLEKSLVEQEVGLTEAALSKIAPAPEVRTPSCAPKARTREPENWNVRAAAEIEENAVTEALIAETSRVSLASSKTSTGAIPKSAIPKTAKKKKKRARQPSVPQDGSPFHYSPPRTPPEYRGGPPSQSSPFHYSPPKTPPGFRQSPRQASPFHYSPQRTSGLMDEAAAVGMETTTVTTRTTTVEQPPACNLPRPRKSLAPRDSWSGFG